MEINSILLGRRIKKVRKEANLSAKELAELCHMSYVYARKIEAGEKTPSLFIFTNICNVLKVTPEYLLSDALEFSNGEEDWEKYESVIQNYTPKQIELIKTTIAGIIKYFDN